MRSASIRLERPQVHDRRGANVGSTAPRLTSWALQMSRHAKLGVATLCIDLNRAQLASEYGACNGPTGSHRLWHVTWATALRWSKRGTDRQVGVRCGCRDVRVATHLTPCGTRAPNLRFFACGLRPVAVPPPFSRECASPARSSSSLRRTTRPAPRRPRSTRRWFLPGFRCRSRRP